MSSTALRTSLRKGCRLRFHRLDLASLHRPFEPLSSFHRDLTRSRRTGTTQYGRSLTCSCGGAAPAPHSPATRGARQLHGVSISRSRGCNQGGQVRD
ncbi:hypothetical protein GW17_00048090 [Ensete ventricosum]|nr:hypothetical protein GW17_00048090 [Ensete ventricosum]